MNVTENKKQTAAISDSRPFASDSGNESKVVVGRMRNILAIHAELDAKFAEPEKVCKPEKKKPKRKEVVMGTKNYNYDALVEICESDFDAESLVEMFSEIEYEYAQGILRNKDWSGENPAARNHLFWLHTFGNAFKSLRKSEA